MKLRLPENPFSSSLSGSLSRQENSKKTFENYPLIYPLNKPAGISSFDCIRQVRPFLLDQLGRGSKRNRLKIGHFGTLDPFADGLLLIGSGKAMQLMNIVQELLPKSYEAHGITGVKTITGDHEGEVIDTCELNITDEKLLKSLEKKAQDLTGTYWQKPPYFSAVKHEGKPLYEYARDGIFIDKPAVCRTIYSLKVLGVSNLGARFECSVSSGTYIRSLWQDMLCDHNGIGHLTKLTRSAYGAVTLEKALGPKEFCERDELNFIYPWELLKFESIELEYSNAVKLLNGARPKISPDKALKNQYYWIESMGHKIALVQSIGVDADSGYNELHSKVLFY